MDCRSKIDPGTCVKEGPIANDQEFEINRRIEPHVIVYFRADRTQLQELKNRAQALPVQPKTTWAMPCPYNLMGHTLFFSFRSLKRHA